MRWSAWGCIGKSVLGERMGVKGEEDVMTGGEECYLEMEFFA